MNNLRTSPLSSCKNLPPYFLMVHLLHRLYGVDAPAIMKYLRSEVDRQEQGQTRKEWVRKRCDQMGMSTPLLSEGVPQIIYIFIRTNWSFRHKN